jgi:hypothetical protein
VSKYTEAAFVLQQVYKVVGDIEKLAGCKSAKVRGSSEWVSNVNSSEENSANFCKVRDEKLFLPSLRHVHSNNERIEGRSEDKRTGKTN